MKKVIKTVQMLSGQECEVIDGTAEEESNTGDAADSSEEPHVAAAEDPDYVVVVGHFCNCLGCQKRRGALEVEDEGVDEDAKSEASDAMSESSLAAEKATPVDPSKGGHKKLLAKVVEDKGGEAAKNSKAELAKDTQAEDAADKSKAAADHTQAEDAADKSKAPPPPHHLCSLSRRFFNCSITWRKNVAKPGYIMAADRAGMPARYLVGVSQKESSKYKEVLVTMKRLVKDGSMSATNKPEARAKKKELIGKTK